MSKAIFVREIGGPEVLSFESHDPGEPGPGMVRVRTGAIGVNYIDVYFRSGAYPRPTPFVLGFEGAGTIESVGSECVDLAVGDRVAWASVPSS